VDSMIAFDRLRRAARDTQSKIGDVAQRLVSTGRLPTETSRRTGSGRRRKTWKYPGRSARSQPLAGPDSGQHSGGQRAS
jgi:hypothetical protein